MVQTVLKRPGAKIVEVVEYFGGLPEAQQDNRIDEAAGIIRDVKVCGLQSINIARILGLGPEFGDALDLPYDYDPSALQEAIGLYDRCYVYVDHPRSAFDENMRRVIAAGDREMRSHFGRLVNPRFVEGDGIRADLEYLTTHPEAATVIERARRMPEQIGLSHRAVLTCVLKNGRVCVTNIRQIKSVDLVAGLAGTTVTLFESAVMTPEELAAQKAAAGATEDGDGAGDGSGMGGVGAANPDTRSPDELIKAGIMEAAMKIIGGDGTAADKIKSLTPILEQFDALAGAMGGGAAAAPAAAAAGSGSSNESGAGASQKILDELANLRKRDAARDKLAAAGIEQKPVYIKSVAALESAADQDALIAEIKRGSDVEAAESYAPRSGGTGDTSGASAGRINGEEFAKRMRAGV